jgi:hypothetical protein
MDLDDAEGFAAVGQAQPLIQGDSLMAVPEDYQTVGHLYRGIEHGLERLVGSPRRGCCWPRIAFGLVFATLDVRDSVHQASESDSGPAHHRAADRAAARRDRGRRRRGHGHLTPIRTGNQRHTA